MTEHQHRPEQLDLLWGCAAIAKAIGRTQRQTFHMLEAGDISPARQVGRRWVVSRKALTDFFEGRENAA